MQTCQSKKDILLSAQICNNNNNDNNTVCSHCLGLFY